MANPETGGNWPNLLAKDVLFKLVISVHMWEKFYSLGVIANVSPSSPFWQICPVPHFLRSYKRVHKLIQQLNRSQFWKAGGSLG